MLLAHGRGRSIGRRLAVFGDARRVSGGLDPREEAAVGGAAARGCADPASGPEAVPPQRQKCYSVLRPRRTSPGAQPGPREQAPETAAASVPAATASRSMARRSRPDAAAAAGTDSQDAASRLRAKEQRGRGGRRGAEGRLCPRAPLHPGPQQSARRRVGPAAAARRACQCVTAHQP